MAKDVKTPISADFFFFFLPAMACEAPVRWLKYTTHIITLSSCLVINLYARVVFGVTLNHFHFCRLQQYGNPVTFLLTLETG